MASACRVLATAIKRRKVAGTADSLLSFTVAVSSPCGSVEDALHRLNVYFWFLTECDGQLWEALFNDSSSLGHQADKGDFGEGHWSGGVHTRP